MCFYYVLHINICKPLEVKLMRIPPHIFIQNYLGSQLVLLVVMWWLLISELLVSNSGTFGATQSAGRVNETSQTLSPQQPYAVKRIIR